MGSREKRKGARGERELAMALSEVLGVRCHRGRQYHGGPEAPDVVVDIPGLHVECKRCEGISVYKAMEQSQKDAGLGKIPIVCHRRNRKDWIVMLYLRDLKRFVQLLSYFIDKGE